MYKQKGKIMTKFVAAKFTPTFTIKDDDED